VQEGPASQSYGLQVAALAGVPAPVIQSAKKHLLKLEQQEIANDMQGDLFAVAAEEKTPHPLEEALRRVEPDELTPKAALELVYSLRKLLD
jgi:DNA mismatch repair protein MutS